jgi:hypothetical protein
MVSKKTEKKKIATEMKKAKVERLVVTAIGRITGINPGNILLLHRFESDLCMGFAERASLSKTVSTAYDVQIDLVQYSEGKTVGNLVDEIMDRLK